ncbi:amidase [Microterricola viridarii]|nr:amidase [Microterricola viridarii]
MVHDVMMLTADMFPTAHPHSAAPASGGEDARSLALAVSEQAMRQHRDSNIVILDTLERARSAPAPGDGPLAGFTLAVKDMIDIAGLPTSRGSALYGGLDSLQSAECVTLLESAGAALVAKVNLHEFAYGVSNENPHWGDVLNPTYPHLIPGGSSGGTAAAVAAGIARIGLGTDTAGSIRMPAACCGVVGLRPRTGRVAGRGVAPLAPSFDVVGPMAASVSDTALAWSVLSGEALAGARPLRGLVVGVIEGSVAAEPLREAGAELRPFTLPDGVLDVFWTAFRAEVTRTHEGTYPRSAAAYSENVRAKLAAASGVTAAAHRSALASLAVMREELLSRMTGVDVLASDTLGCPTPPVGADELDYRDDLGRLVAPFSALDLPALAIGNLQIVGRTEAEVLAVGLGWEHEVGTIPRADGV